MDLSMLNNYCENFVVKNHSTKENSKVSESKSQKSTFLEICASVKIVSENTDKINISFEERLQRTFKNDNVRVEVIHNAAERNAFRSKGEALGPKDLSVFIPEDVYEKAKNDPEYAQQVVDNIVTWKNDYDTRDYAYCRALGYNPVTYSATTSHAFLLDGKGQVEDFSGTSTGWLPEDMYQCNGNRANNSRDNEIQAKKLRQKKLQKKKLEELLEQKRLMEKRINENRLEELRLQSKIDLL